MWSNFTDFAIKAQKDLQDQANEAAAKLQQQLPPISVRPCVLCCNKRMALLVVIIWFHLY